MIFFPSATGSSLPLERGRVWNCNPCLRSEIKWGDGKRWWMRGRKERKTRAILLLNQKMKIGQRGLYIYRGVMRAFLVHRSSKSMHWLCLSQNDSVVDNVFFSIMIMSFNLVWLALIFLIFILKCKFQWKKEKAHYLPLAHWRSSFA